MAGTPDTIASTAYFFNGTLRYARRAPLESPIAAIARSTKHRLGCYVAISYDHAATLDRGMGEDVYRCAWFDVASETFREAMIIVEGTRG